MSSVGPFIGILMSSRNQAHVFHLTTTSFSAHKALQAYYEGIIPLVDTYAEVYMGKTKKRIPGITTGINKKIITDARFAQKYFLKLAIALKSIKLPKDPYLDNIKQEIDALLRQTVYMLSLK